MALRRKTLDQLLNAEDPEYAPLPGEEAFHGTTVDTESVDYRAWGGVGRRLYMGRKSRQISNAEAARRAGISEALWRLLENGGRRVNDKWILPNPSPENLLAAALAVGQDPAWIFAEADLHLPSTFIREMHDDRLSHKITHLSERDRHVVERLVDSMLESDRSAPTPDDQQASQSS